MPEYRRTRIHGSTVFITLITYQRLPIFHNPDVIDILRFAWKNTIKNFPFTTGAVCILPDHIHALITLPQNDDNYPVRIREIKRRFTRGYLLHHHESIERNSSHVNKQESTLWQRRYWEHTIRDENDYQNHFNYIHYNPVKHGLVENVSSWPWSSFRRYVRLGIYDEDWGTGYKSDNNKNNFGE